MGEGQTVLIPEARWKLLRELDAYETWRRKREAEAQLEAGLGVVSIHTGAVTIAGTYPVFVPLWENDKWGVEPDDLLLAVRECSRLGEIEVGTGYHPNGPMVRITTAGQEAFAKLATPARKES